MRRFLAYFFLALSLAAAGPAAYAHALAHLGDPAASQPHAGDGGGQQQGHACELCAAFGGAGVLGAAPAPLGIASASSLGALLPQPDRLTPCEALARFASRAPPLPA